jgi:thioredoxin 1
MPIIHLNSENFENVVKENDLVVVDFWASWCGPCRMLGQVLEDINAKNPDLVIAKVNVDEEMGLARSFGIRSIPQLYIYKNGNIVKNISGYVGENVILEAIK